MTEQNKAESELDRLNGCAVALGFSDVSELVEQTAKDRLLALSRPTQTADAVEAATRQEKPHRNVQKRWKVKRKAVEGNLMGKAFKKAFPDWAHELGFLGYARMGWVATMNGKTVANGQWGDELWLLKDGTFASNNYPFGYSADAAIEKGRIVWEREQAALSHTAPSEATPTHDSGLAGELRKVLSEKEVVVVGLCGEDFAWQLLDKGASIRDKDWTILTALQSNSDSELQWCLQQFVNAYQTGMIETPAEETMASVMRRSLATLARLEQGAA